MKYAEEPIVRRYDDPRLFDILVEDKKNNLRSRYFSPAYHPKKWFEYLDAAELSYAKHGVACAVRREDCEKTPCPSFWMIEDQASGKLLGGMRNHGPYPSSGEVWALQEMRAHERHHELVRFVDPLIAHGVMENKGVFIDPGIDRVKARSVSDMLLRLQAVSIDLIGASALVGTSAKHTLSMWARGGFEIVCPHISVPYPNEKYQTVVVTHLTKRRHRLMDPVLRLKAREDLNSIHDSLLSLETVS